MSAFIYSLLAFLKALKAAGSIQEADKSLPSNKVVH